MVKINDAQIFYRDEESGEIKMLGGEEDPIFENLLEQVNREEIEFVINYEPCVLSYMVADLPSDTLLAHFASDSVCPSCGGRHVLELTPLKLLSWQEGTMYTHEARCPETEENMLFGLRGDDREDG